MQEDLGFGWMNPPHLELHLFTRNLTIGFVAHGVTSDRQPHCGDTTLLKAVRAELIPS